MVNEATKRKNARLARQRQVIKRETVEFIKRHHPSFDLRLIKNEVGNAIYGRKGRR